MSLPPSVRRFVVPLAVAVAILVLPVATARPAAACSCVAKSDESRLGESVAVFSGEVIGHDQFRDQTNRSAGTSLWTFSVSRVFKGTVGLTVRVASSFDGMSCGVEFPATGPVLVFTRAAGVLAPPVVGVDLSAGCGGSRSLVGAQVPPAFGEGVEPGGPPPLLPGATSNDGPWVLWGTIGGTMAVAALAAGLLIGRRRARRSKAV